MTEHPENIPGFRTIRVGAPRTPVAALADEEAWRARDGYPDLRFAGGPVFGVAREREAGGWELLRYVSSHTPQDARDTMGGHFRRLADEAAAPDGGDTDAGGGTAGDGGVLAAEFVRAAERMDWERLDEVAVAGTRYRVVRAERFTRSGPDGPEPPRATDPDPAEPGAAHEAADPAEGFVLDPFTPTGMSEGILKAELLGLVRGGAAVPGEVRDDAARAGESHPGGVLLPPSFMTSEYVGGRWKPLDNGTSTTPQGARDSLSTYLRVIAPWRLRLDEATQAEYAAAADRFDAARQDELDFAGRRFRIVRVERLVRIGPDGPEGPRASDFDPQPPVMVQTQELADQGLLDEPDEPDAAQDEEVRRFTALFQRESERLAGLERRRRRPHD